MDGKFRLFAAICCLMLCGLLWTTFVFDFDYVQYSKIIERYFRIFDRNVTVLNNSLNDDLVEITRIMQMRIFNLQHPKDCMTAKKINCNIGGGCGLGCQLHTISYCLIVGYSKKRLVLPIEGDWIYSPNQWSRYFLPLSNCTRQHAMNVFYHQGTDEDIPILNIPHYKYPLPTLPMAFPKEFSEQLFRSHSYPPLFWIGQFMKYLMRFQPTFQNYTNDKMNFFKFRQPIAGIHVRRTDKLNDEAHRFEVDEYMKHISAWFDKNVSKNVKRRVYIATDDHQVINESVSKYKDYDFLFDYQTAQEVHQNRYTESSLRDIVTSVHLLSNCDFVVCTLSSNICRLVYELMQIIRNQDYSNNVISLDTFYYYHGQQSRYQIAAVKHTPSTSDHSEIEMNVGDVLEVISVQDRLSVNRTNEFKGFMEGRNVRTNKSGKYPMNKVKEEWRIVEFPKYT